jgi:anthranilate phosphoribosyltransferase
VLASLGCERALIVHGDGLDEVALHAETDAMRLIDGGLDWVTLTPEEAGLERAPIAHLAGGDAEENAARLRALLSGAGSPAERNMVAINTGALLVTAGLAGGLRDGTARALDALASGNAGKRLDAFIEASRA